MIMKEIKAVIFDFNGVLFWDSHLHDKAWKEYSKELRGTEFTDKELNEIMRGRTNKDIVEYLLGKELDIDEAIKYSDHKEEIYREMCLQMGEDLKLSPGAIGFLNYLKKNDIPHTIATSSEINNLNFFWLTFELGKWFNLNNIAYDDGTVRGKPQPDLYLKAADNLKIKPEYCTVFEDAKSGITAAHNANVGQIIALTTKENQADFKDLPGVTDVILDFQEVLTKIEKGNINV
jgi:HAD superfamily hydrolase (TIGR01509 family)